jgi:2,4-didehydro-3-deoxy-L-rhamnonate hydrolase
MRLANVQGRAAVVLDGKLVDVERATGGRLPADPMALIPQLDALRDVEATPDAPSLEDVRLGPPVPRPQKILAIGLNYRGHAEESGLSVPDEPVVFAKLPSALCGPTDEIAIPAGRSRVDWEAELVVVIGRRGRGISAADAWSYVAGVTCGQDVSDREEQFRALRQFTVAKSYDTFAPLGPVLVTPDELANPDDLAIRCRLDGEEVQSSRTSDFIFDVRTLVEWISRWITFEAGDLIFTGTPSGVGDSRQPPRYLAPWTVVETDIESVGVMRNRCT